LSLYRANILLGFLPSQSLLVTLSSQFLTSFPSLTISAGQLIVPISSLGTALPMLKILMEINTSL
jgi:hypothetical protein